MDRQSKMCIRDRPSKAPIQEGPADRRQLLLIIKNKYGALSRASKTIADFILAHHDEAIYLNIRQIAEMCIRDR